jgi:hypothetical protein
MVSPLVVGIAYATLLPILRMVSRRPAASEATASR